MEDVDTVNTKSLTEPLDDLKGREKFKDIPVCALTHFKGE